MIYYDDCRACRDTEFQWEARQRHKEQMRQAEKHHRQQMAQQSRSSSSFVSGATRTVVGSGMGLSFGGVVLALLLIVPVLGVLLLISVLSVVASLVTVLIQAAFTGAALGTAAGVLTYLVQRRRLENSEFHFQRTGRDTPLKQRTIIAYRSLDPATKLATNVGAVVAGVAFFWSITF